MYFFIFKVLFWLFFMYNKMWNLRGNHAQDFKIEK